MHASHKLEAARQEFLEAQRLYADRQYGAALEILDALDKQYPASKNILFARGDCLAQLFRTVEAVKILVIVFLARYEFPEARELKMQLIKSDGMPPSVNLESSVDLRPWILASISSPEAIPDPGPARRRPRWHWALAGCVILAIAGLVLYAGMTLLGS